MLGYGKLFNAPEMALDEIQARWPGGELKNDRIKRFAVDIIGHGGRIVSPCFYLEAAQPLGCGYVSTDNIGFIIRRIADLLDLWDDDRRDFGENVKNCPLRIYSWGSPGSSLMKGICIGHFMADRFVYGWDLMLTGLPLELVEKLKVKGGEE